MTYSVYQHWDPLKVCIVGRSYSPKVYDYIENESARRVMQRIAEETEEDYQKLISLLQNFGVEVLRPNEQACEELALSAIRESKKIPKIVQNGKG